MEVILKKTKISNSILKQTVRATDIDFVNGIVLGWCIYDKMKYIVCYREDIKTLFKYPMFKEIEYEILSNENNNHKFEGYLIKVRLGGNYVPFSYLIKTEIEKDVFIALFEKAKKDAETKGQFYI